MKLHNYLNVSILEKHITDRVVDVRFHDKFPLAIYTYGRKAVFDNVWDDVTRKCRGLIVDTDTGEILARPFEKFFNVDTAYIPETKTENLPQIPPVVLEKLDGSLGIRYRYNGKDYIASKGSFSSPHAKWACEWYNKNVINPTWPDGFTPIFEIIAPSVQRIVVNYDFHALVLLTLINVETGEEADYNTVYHWAKINGLNVPKIHAFTLEQARMSIYQVDPETTRNEEGYVLSWPRQGTTPLRVKVKFEEYCRLHKLITSTSPRVILEMLENNLEGVVDYHINESTPAFSEFMQKWVKKFKTEYNRIAGETVSIYAEAISKLGAYSHDNRKAYALFFTQEENKKYSALLFLMLDGKDCRASIYKMLYDLTRYEEPLVTDLE